MTVHGINSKRKVLIVDDDKNISAMLASFFDHKGFTVLSADNGAKAIEYVEDVSPDIVLLDIVMPGMDGILTLNKMLEMKPDLPVIMITGVDDEETAREATDLGAYAYITKPFDMKYLEMTILTRLLMDEE